MLRLRPNQLKAPPALLRYGMAVLISLLALALTQLLLPFMQSNMFLLAFPAVVLSAWYGGFGPSLLSIAVMSLSIGYLFLSPSGSFHVDVGDAIRLSVFAMIALLISSLTETSRRSARSAHQQSEESSITLASIGDAVITTDVHGRVRLMNPVAEALTGWVNAAAIGQHLSTIFQLIDQETRQPVESPIDHILREGKVVMLPSHTLLVAKDGSERPIDDSGAPIRDSAGTISGIVIVFRDMTNRKQAENLLKRYQMLSEQTRDLILFFDHTGRIIEANRAATAAYGYSRETLLTKTIADLRDSAGSGALEATLRPTDADHALVETVHRRSDGTIFPVEISSLQTLIDGEPVLMSIIRDISTRRRTEVERARLASIVESSDDAIIGMTLDGTILSWNSGAERLYYYAAQEMRGQPITLLVPPDRTSEVQLKLERVRRGERVDRLDTTRLRKDGVAIPVSLTTSPIKDATGMITGASIIARDITDRKLAERALRISEERFRTMADSAPVLIWVSGTDMRSTFFNQVWLDFTGLSIDQALDTGWVASVHPDDQQQSMHIYATHFERRQPFSMEYRLRRADGDYRWVLDTGVPQLTSDDVFVGYIGSCIDITERKQSADRTARLQAITAALSEALTPAQVADVILQQGIPAVGGDAGSITLLDSSNTQLETIGASGYSTTAVGKWQSFSAESETPVAEAVRTKQLILIESRAALVSRYRLMAGSQSASDYNAWALVPMQVEGRVTGALAMSFAHSRSFDEDDRTFMRTLASQCALALERARLYESEQQARASAEVAVHVREQFLSIAAHELKTPLTSMIGYAQLFQRRAERAGNLTEADLRALRVIVDQSSRLQRMVSALLDISRIDTGQLSIHSVSLDLGVLVRRILDDLETQPHQRAIELNAPAQPIMVSGDDLRLEQVIQNLIQNAIKYSPSGAPVLVQVGQQDGSAFVAVTDRGIGIPRDAIPQLFQRFYRAPNVAAHQISGMGIGLYVVKEIMALHNGTIQVESQEGQGSTFTIELPLEAVAVSSP